MIKGGDDSKEIFTVHLDIEGKVADGKGLPPSEKEPTYGLKRDIVVSENIIPWKQIFPAISIGIMIPNQSSTAEQPV
jgi:hypothetical protein